MNTKPHYAIGKPILARLSRKEFSALKLKPAQVEQAKLDQYTHIDSGPDQSILPAKTAKVVPPAS